MKKRPSSNQPVKKNVTPTNNANEDILTGLIARNINFDYEMNAYITGSVNTMVMKYIASKKKMNAAAQNKENENDPAKEELIKNIYNDISKRFEKYDFDIIRTNGKMEFWGNSKHSMFISFSLEKNEDSYLILANPKK